MSLSWRDRLYVALSPARVDVMRVAGVLRPSAEYLELMPGIEVVAQAAWRGPLHALSEALPRLAPRGARCAVVLSNHFCRYVLVPGNADLADGREMEAYARLKLEETYGAAAVASWDVCVARAAPGASRLACAVDTNLMKELRSVCRAAKVKLASVRPLLAASFDQSRSRFASGKFWFASAEAGRVCLAAVENYAWRSVTSQRIGRNLTEELRGMLDRAFVSSPGVRTDTVYLFSRDQSGDRARCLPGVTVLPLTGREDRTGQSDAARGRVFA